MIYTIVLFDQQNNPTDTVSIDAITDFSESYSATATSHPVETGTPLTDNLIKNNDKFTVSGVVSDFSLKGFGKKLIIQEDGGIIVDPNSTTNTIEDRAYNTKQQLINLIKVGSVVGIVISKKELPNDEGYVVTNQGIASGSSIEIKYPCVCTGVDFSDSGGEYGVIRPKLQFEQIRVATTRTEKVDKVPAVLTKVTPGSTSTTGDATGETGDLPDGSNAANNTNNANNANKKYEPPDPQTKMDVYARASQLAAEDAVAKELAAKDILDKTRKLANEIRTGNPEQINTKQALDLRQNTYIYRQ